MNREDLRRSAPKQPSNRPEPQKTSMIAPLYTSLLLAAPALVGPVDDPLISIWIEDLGAMSQNPKDAALMRAMEMMPARVMELREEVPLLAEMPPAALEIALHAMSGRKSLRVFEGGSDSPLPLGMQLEFQEGDATSAREFGASVTGFMAGSGAPLSEADASGMRNLETPMGVPIQLGTQDDRFIVAMGSPASEAGKPMTMGLPEGARPVMSMDMQLGRLLEFGLEMASMGSPEEADAAMGFMDALGLYDLRMQMSIGADEEWLYSTASWPGYVESLRAMGSMPARGLTAADLARVPDDAIWAVLSTWNASGTVNVLANMPEFQAAFGGDPLDALTAVTGFDLRAEFLDHFGSVVALYASESTGGGGMMSMVALMELTDSEGMLETIERVSDLIVGLGMAEADGYVGIRSWEHQGADLFTLAFPGLPVPGEPTLAVADGHLIFGMTPQATLAAISQMGSGSTGLADHPRFRESVPADIEGALALSFNDTPALARSGYGMISMMGSSVANGMRSRGDDPREAGLVVPLYHDLVDGAHASVTVTRIEGENLVQRGRADSSILVNMAGLAGGLQANPMAMALLGSMFFTAQETSSMSFPLEEEWDVHPEHEHGEDW